MIFFLPLNRNCHARFGRLENGYEFKSNNNSSGVKHWWGVFYECSILTAFHWRFFFLFFFFRLLMSITNHRSIGLEANCSFPAASGGLRRIDVVPLVLEFRHLAQHGIPCRDPFPFGITCSQLKDIGIQCEQLHKGIPLSHLRWVRFYVALLQEARITITDKELSYIYTLLS